MLAIQSHRQHPAGDLKTYPVLIPNLDTRLLAPTPPATAQDGTLVSYGPTANEYLVVTLGTGTPFLAASLYNSTNRTMTALTISGALSASATNPESASLAYSVEQAAWYLKEGVTGTTVRVYPLTVSGTTLTIGAPVDHDASFAGNANDILMTSDKTDLWFLDVSDGTLKKYDLSVPSMGGAQAAPATGYYTSDITNAHFRYSNGKIYFYSSATNNGLPITFQEYNIAGNAWTSKTIPIALRGNQVNETIMLPDPDSNTHVYFVTGVQETNIESMLVRWKSSDDTSEIYSFVSAMVSGPGVTSSAQTMTAGFYTAAGTLRGGELDVSGGDMIAIGDVGTSYSNGRDVVNAGTKHGEQTLLSYTGSGFLTGLQSGRPPTVSSTAMAGPVYNSAATWKITVDGGTEREVCMGFLPSDYVLNIPFATSLTVKAIGTAQSNASGGNGATISLLIRS